MSVSQNTKQAIVAFGIGIAVALGFGLFALGFVVNEKLNPQVQPVQAAKPLDAYTIYNLVNAERVKAGLKPLLLDPSLVATAQARADDMVARNYFSHFDPVDGHKLINDKTDLGGQKQCLYASENISEKGSTEQEAVGGWMGSKPHHDAILDERYTSTGVAVNGDKVVQHFCQTK